MKSSATSLPSACSACPATSGSTRMCRSTRSRPRGDDPRVPDAVQRHKRVNARLRRAMAVLRRAGTWSPMGPGSAAHRYTMRCVRVMKASGSMVVSVNQKQDRIGVLEELLSERYSCRAFRPEPVPRPVIERVLTDAQRTASWCNSQPWQVVIASGAAKERFRKSIYAEAASGAEDGHDFTPPREYLGVYLQRRRESGFQLYNALGIAHGDKPAYLKQAL